MDANSAGDSIPASRKWRRLAIWLTIPASLVAVVWGYWAWGAYQLLREEQALRDKYQTSNLRFSAKRCSTPYTPPFPPDSDPQLGVQRMVWSSDGRLVVTVREINGCSAWIPLGRYTVNQDALRLEAYATYRSKVRAACDCAYEMEFGIAGLPAKTYKASFAWLRDLD
jgi:hypothetical protein